MGSVLLYHYYFSTSFFKPNIRSWRQCIIVISNVPLEAAHKLWLNSESCPGALLWGRNHGTTANALQSPGLNYCQQIFTQWNTWIPNSLSAEASALLTNEMRLKQQLQKQMWAQLFAWQHAKTQGESEQSCFNIWTNMAFALKQKTIFAHHQVVLEFVLPLTQRMWSQLGSLWRSLFVVSLHKQLHDKGQG